MQYKQLSNTGVIVSKLCLGAMTFGGEGGIFKAIGAIGQKEVDALVHRSIDAGINFFDTANMYAFGESETMLGKALEGKRHDHVIATKVRFRMGPGPNDVGLSRLHIMRQVEESLKRLNTDYIDLYQIHRFDEYTDISETLRALDDLVRQGKVRYLGCSNLAGWQLMKALGVSRQHSLEEFKSIQSYYSIAGRELERELVPVIQDQNVGLMVWSPLAGGFLTGKFTREGEADPTARRAQLFDFPPIDKEKGYDIIDVMREIGDAHNVSVAQIALAWLLHQDVVTSVIIGAKKMSQLEDNLNSVNVELSDDEMTRLDEVSALTPEYPGWMRLSPPDRLPGQGGWADVADELMKKNKQ